jgi:IrrE N-terminal-like domain
MTPAIDPIAAVAALRRDLSFPVEPERRGPVALNPFFEEMQLAHVALPDLTVGLVIDYLRQNAIPIDETEQREDPLAGYLFAAGRIGWAFVRADDILPRRRFTAAHELGHFVLHRERMQSFSDTNESISEGLESADLKQMEREANQVAVELLMPAEVCRERAVSSRKKHGCCPRRVLAYSLAAELLVSGEAMSYRLKALGVGDE